MTRAESRHRPPSKTGRRSPKAKAPPVFAQWLEAMGFNKKQVSAAGALLGLSTPKAVRRNRGATEPTITERLAMSAVRAGLEPWSPAVEADLATRGIAPPALDDASDRRLAKVKRLRAEGLTYAEIGRKVKLTGERVRQILAENKAAPKIR